MGKFKTFLKVLLTLAILVAVVFGVLWLINFFSVPQGLSVSYNGIAYGNTVLGSSTGGILLPYEQTATFTLNNTDGWGVYSVQDCVVKVVPNVDDAHDFEFTVGDDSRPYVFCGEKDLTAAFCDNYDGNGLPISSDGTFSLIMSGRTVTDVLNAVYTEGVTMDGEYLLSDYPYVALSVTSPDNRELLHIPLRFEVCLGSVDFDKDGIVF